MAVVGDFNVFMKRIKPKGFAAVLAVAIIVFTVIVYFICNQLGVLNDGGVSISGVIGNGGLSTPQLINYAFENGEIREGQRLLYLAYAIYDYELLPDEFRSNVGWEGTSIVAELKEKVSDLSVLCDFDKDVVLELQRIFPDAAECE